MDNKIEVFNNYEFGIIRTITLNDEVWFLGRDVASSLKYQNGSRDINRHVDEEDRQIRTMFDGVQNRTVTFINESGLYSLILGSKLPTAKKFKRWITSEVLPQIRKTGGYIPISQNMSDSEFMARALMIAQKTLDEKDNLISAQKTMIAQKEKEIKILEPLATKWNVYLNQEGLTTIDELSKTLGIKGFGRNNMYKWLKVNKYLQWNNIPYAKYVNTQQLFVIKNAGYHYEGIRKVEDRKAFLTAKGVEYFLDKFIKEGILAS